jgi:hypothetical protein
MEKNEYSTAIVKNKTTGQLETICLDTGEVLNTGINPKDMSKYKFNMDTALLVCQKIREGATLKQIGDDPALPNLTVIHYWRRSNLSFNEEIKLARKERAEYYHDKVLEIAEETVDRDEVSVAKFKTDQYRWAAEKGDPSSYGNKIEHSGSNTAPSIVIVTGIKRELDIEVTEYEQVEEEKSSSEGEAIPSLPCPRQDGEIEEGDGEGTA